MAWQNSQPKLLWLSQTLAGKVVHFATLMWHNQWQVRQRSLLCLDCIHTRLWYFGVCQYMNINNTYGAITSRRIIAGTIKMYKTTRGGNGAQCRECKQLREHMKEK